MSDEAPNRQTLMPKGREDVVFRQLDDEWVLFDTNEHLLHVVNLVGAMIWTACDGETPKEVLIAEIRSSFEDPPALDEIDRDIDETVERFRTEGLLA